MNRPKLILPKLMLTGYANFLMTLGFLTRIPITNLPEPAVTANFRLAAMANYVPVVGAIIGGIAALAMLLAVKLLVLPNQIGAIFAVTILILITGGLHEDGLADSADGLGGGASPEQRLNVMRDSQIGTFGVIALMLSLLLRVALLTALLELLPGLAVASLIGAGAISRTACLWLAVRLPPAGIKPSGLAHQAGSISPWQFLGSATIAMVIATLALASIASKSGVIASGVIAVFFSFLTAELAVRAANYHIKGRNGDVMGATQQLAEISFYAMMLIWMV